MVINLYNATNNRSNNMFEILKFYIKYNYLKMAYTRNVLVCPIF